jgi:DNA-binding transcriptional LysR family regulator
MTLLQIQYAVECARQGSVSKASDTLYTSRSNVSQSLSVLESELEFPIFNRTASGLVPTKKGMEFLNYAFRIISDFNRISSLNHTEKRSVLNISCGHNPMIMKVFVDFVKKQESAQQFQMTLTATSYDECIARVRDGISEMGVIGAQHAYSATIQETLSRNHLHYERIVSEQVNIVVRQGHPLIYTDKNGQLALNYDGLDDYPIVSYSDPEDPSAPTVDFTRYRYSQDSVNSKVQNAIYINDMEWKSKLIESTNAYGVSIGRYSDDRTWEVFPVKNLYADTYIIYHENYDLSQEASAFALALKQAYHDLAAIDTPRL